MSDTPEIQDRLAAPIDICIQNQTDVSEQNQTPKDTIGKHHWRAPEYIILAFELQSILLPKTEVGEAEWHHGKSNDYDDQLEDKL